MSDIPTYVLKTLDYIYNTMQLYASSLYVYITISKQYLSERHSHLYFKRFQFIYTLPRYYMPLSLYVYITVHNLCIHYHATTWLWVYMFKFTLCFHHATHASDNIYNYIPMYVIIKYTYTYVYVYLCLNLIIYLCM